MTINANRKNILVAGGAGFIGSNLCHKLTKDKDNFVICLDNFLTSNQKNIETLLKLDNFIFIKADITDNILVDHKLDQIYNLACPASPIHYQKDPIRTLKICFNGTLNLLELALKHDCTFLQASTSEVYGDPLLSPQSESYLGNVNPIGIRACYDEGKRVAETLIFDFYRKYKLDIKVARIFNTYGPNMQSNDGRVISNFIVQALNGDSLTVYGEGNQTRSFCYVSDMVDGLYRLMNSVAGTVGPINLGNPHEFTVLDAAKEIIKYTNSKSNLIFKDLPQDDPMQRKPDIGLARAMLGWIPVVSFKEGVEKTIYYFKDELSLI